MLTLCNDNYSDKLRSAAAQEDPDKLFTDALDFIDEQKTLPVIARLCWLYLFTDHQQDRRLTVERLAKKVSCTVEQTEKYLTQLENAGLVYRQEQDICK